MGMIGKLVNQTLEQGYLTLNVEAELRNLLQTTRYSKEDFEAFIRLQNAAIDGLVTQESRERLNRLDTAII
ncbi:hypothetical protein [Planktothrix paucivesiculata]|jgi:hypothetical protein|uniref:Uncharacterized protein n=1 Tax=Planktothrix paucivesiculata PCC 9631 TaxID=671071 RepID=A0A7Z9DW35_9CYAN|nr:hypothetical protein [Planktothrix paucivesiculata]VXD14707.1 conserved hypothetical protein [Planktothrix paucivesiculata PCC 9631]